ncbi:hypothetical protein ES702_02408 [subsurface metagenome]
MHTSSKSMEPHSRGKMPGPSDPDHGKCDPKYLVGCSHLGTTGVSGMDAANEERSENRIDMHFPVGIFVSQARTQANFERS